MPYSCAKAVCATFCYQIAGALIPIFGSNFPSECLPPQSSDFARMVIDPVLVAEATRETELMRQAIMRGLEDGAAPSSFHRSQISQPVGGSRDTYRHPEVHSRPSSMHHLVLPPIGSPHTRPVSGSRMDGGPQLAPISYMVPRQGGHLLPSPVEHEKLPPLSCVAVLPPITLPTLFRRDDHEHSRFNHSPRNSHNYSSGQVHQRPCYQLPSLRMDDEAAVTKMEDDSGQLRRPVWDSQPAPASVTPNHQSHWRAEVEDTQSPVPHISNVTHGPIPSHSGEHRSGAVDNVHEDGDKNRFTSSHCYPSPPCRQHTHHHYSTETERRQPLSRSTQFEAEDEVKYTATLKPGKKTTAADSRENDAHCQAQQKTTTKRRKLKVSGGTVGPSSSSSSWNAIDVNAAEVLVNFSVQVKATDDDDEQGNDCDSPRPVHSKRPKNDPRLSASIESLLCDDDETPCNKRRRS